jgi:hypothetical protein
MEWVLGLIERHLAYRWLVIVGVLITVGVFAAWVFRPVIRRFFRFEPQALSPATALRCFALMLVAVLLAPIAHGQQPGRRQWGQQPVRPPVGQPAPIKQPVIKKDNPKQQPPKADDRWWVGKNWAAAVEWCKKHPGETNLLGLLFAILSLLGIDALLRRWVGYGLRYLAQRIVGWSSEETPAESQPAGAVPPSHLDHKDKPKWKRKKKRVPCKVCDETGQLNGRKCWKCNGWTSIYTYRKGQPSCPMCKGSAKSQLGLCELCWGVGLQPYESDDDLLIRQRK